MKGIRNLLILSIFVCSVFIACSNNENDFELIPVKQNDKWGYINHKGEFVINPQFDDAECFFDNLARVNPTLPSLRYFSLYNSKLVICVFMFVYYKLFRF
ncbi:MAG: WG repeat-containing protein [Bacteroidales bacterium]|nr:WG repeat-containing protein [Bacteroidales bacterium]